MIVYIVWHMDWNPANPSPLEEIFATRELAQIYINIQEFPDNYEIEEFTVKGRII